MRGHVMRGHVMRGHVMGTCDEGLGEHLLFLISVKHLLSWSAALLGNF